MKDQVQNINIPNLDPTRIGGSFWNMLGKPIFCLAPMEEVTDVVFREMFAKYSGSKEKNILRPPGSPKFLSKILGWLSGENIFYNENKNIRFSTRACPEPAEGSNATVFNNFVMFTEFINVDGILHPTGFERLKIDLEYTENQRPIVAQIWGTDPEKFYEASKLMVSLGFDGIDINMGCPQDKEIGIGACAALIRNPGLASEIIEATKKGAGDLPVSVKTRLGYSKADEMEVWVKHLLKHNIAALTLHARTKQEKSKVPAQWEKIREAVEIRNSLSSAALIIGNGDVKNREEGLKRILETGCDGVMIARGAFGNPWMFNSSVVQGIALPISDVKQATGLHYISAKEKLSVMLEHARLFNEKLGSQKSFVIMRKHFKAYASGFAGSHELRAKLLETKSLGEAEEIVQQFLKLREIGN